ncbi:PadR family transcriptional regulator [bacterium]|nr:PadR family transcriptional regulator [bacterium]
MTIYSVKKNILKFFGAYTNPSHGTIYPSLKKMLSENIVTVHDVLSNGGKKSSYYSITDKGEKFFIKLMLSDFSENPSIFLQDINIRIASMKCLNNENKKSLIDKCIKSMDLYAITLNRSLNDEYSGLDIFQKSVMMQTLKQTLQFIEYLKNLKV